MNVVLASRLSLILSLKILVLYSLFTCHSQYNTGALRTPCKSGLPHRRWYYDMWEKIAQCLSVEFLLKMWTSSLESLFIYLFIFREIRVNTNKIKLGTFRLYYLGSLSDNFSLVFGFVDFDIMYVCMYRVFIYLEY